MELSTDRLGLNNLDIFRIIRQNLPDNRSQTKNIIECKDDVLFLWNARDDCLLTQNLKTVGTDSAKYQALVPTDPPPFAVERILCCESGLQVALFGPRGLAVLDLPKRWGHHGHFDGGKKPSITCRCRSVDEANLTCSSHLEIRQVRWHPGSPTDSHLLVLTSDNSFRLYDTSAHPVSLLQVWRLGRVPQGVLTSGTRLPLLGGLGETAVDFDFAPPFVPKSKRDSPAGDVATAVEWPIMVLRGNGDVYSVTAPIAGKREVKALVRGPLTMYPPADDNYGVDACSVMVLHTAPPILVVGSSAGTLHHCLLLAPEDEEDDQGADLSVVDDEDAVRKTRVWKSPSHNCVAPLPVLHVVESVELELGLSLDDESVDDAYTYSCPLQLHRHPVASDRYLVSHEAGIHILFLPLVAQLEQYLEAPEEECRLYMPAFGAQANSVAEYLLCTRVVGPSSGDVEQVSSLPSPILGIALNPSPPTLIALLAGGEVVSLTLASLNFPTTPSLLTSGHSSDGTKPTKERFDEHIRKALKSTTVQPILKLSKNSTPSPQEAMELVTRATQLFREQYFQRHERVREQIERRISTLQALKKKQLEDLSNLENEREELQAAAEGLAVKYEDLKDKQELLTERAERVLRMASMKQPVVSSAELRMASDLNSIQEKVKALKKKLEDVRSRWNYQRIQMNQWKTQQKKLEVQIGPNQHGTIKNNLNQVTDEISNLVQKINAGRAELGM